MAIGYAICDDKEETLKWIKNSFNRGFLNYNYATKHNLHFRKFDNDERFQSLYSKIKEAWQSFEFNIDI